MIFLGRHDILIPYMKRFLIIFSLSLSGILLSPPAFLTGQECSQGTSTGKTLKEFYFEALKNSETITISQEAVRKAEALYRETLGGSLPELSYRRQATFEDKADSTHDGMFRIEKTDLTGYSELAALRSGKSTVHQRKYEFERAQQLLLRDVAQAFYSILLAEENVTATEKLITLAQERLQELKERVRVGRTREADVLGQEALMASLESQLEESSRQLSARKDLLAFLVGATNSDDTLEDTPIIVQAPSLENYLALANNRPDIRAAGQNVNAQKGLRQVAIGAYLPSLNLSANSFTDRSGSEDSGEWDVLLSVDVPLWDWGNRRGAVGAADAVLHQAEKSYQYLGRQADLEIRNAYRDYESAKNQLAIVGKGVDLARRDYEMQAQDDRRGLVTNLEVFESLSRLNSAELALNNARLKEKMAAIDLEITSGAKPDEILK
jgi:outer membrane protein TolC